MAYEAQMICDSISPNDKRLCTMQITYPRMVHSEFMTHRQFSRNAASSRAIPISKMIDAVMNDPVMPVWWGKNQSGMQAREELTGDALEEAKQLWLLARDMAVSHVTDLSSVGLHKQIANRILEPWMWITVVVSATEWSNFFALRCHPDAQPEFQKIAVMIKELYILNNPTPVGYREYHLPYITEQERTELPLETLLRVSTARCARVSYLRQGEQRDIEADTELWKRLANHNPPHASPLEHIATPSDNSSLFGNFNGWAQYRKQLGI